MSSQKEKDAKADMGTSHPPLADWQLPPGVDRGLWDYIRNDGVARTYDASLAGSSLFACTRWQASLSAWVPSFAAVHFDKPVRFLLDACRQRQLYRQRHRRPPLSRRTSSRENLN